MDELPIIEDNHVLFDIVPHDADDVLRRRVELGDGLVQPSACHGVEEEGAVSHVHYHHSTTAIVWIQLLNGTWRVQPQLLHRAIHKQCNSRIKIFYFISMNINHINKIQNTILIAYETHHSSQ